MCKVHDYNVRSGVGSTNAVIGQSGQPLKSWGMCGKCHEKVSVVGWQKGLKATWRDDGFLAGSQGSCFPATNADMVPSEQDLCLITPTNPLH